MSIGLESRGLTPGSFGIGNIDQNNGKNIYSTTAARMSYKIYLESGITVKIMNSTYQFEVFQYSNNNDIESGFVRKENGTYFNNTPFTVSISNYYRLVVSKREGGTIDQNELSTIVSAFEISGSQAVIHASDLKVIGMVTFASLSETDPTSPDYDPRTIIDGGFIKTGTVTAGKINAYGLEIKSTRRGQTDVNEYTSFKIGNDGQVTIDGNVNLSESSVISFSGGTTKTIGQVANEDIAKAIADGTYDGGTFINGETILTNEFIAQAKITETDTGSVHRTGRFVLKDNGGTGGTSYERLVIRYTDQTMTDGSPGIYFDTNDNNSFHFNRPIITTRGVDISKSTEQGAPDPISHIGGSVFFTSGSVLNMSEGIAILGHYHMYFDNYQDLLTRMPTPQQGQIAFVLA